MPLHSGKPSRNFSQRVSALIGGNRWARGGALQDFPLSIGPATWPGYYVHWNDFDYGWSMDAGATAPAGYTLDWTAAAIGAANLNAATLLTTIPYGIVRVDAGDADSTGERITRVATGVNIATPFILDSTVVTSADGTTRYRRLAYEVRARVNEVGTASQSAFSMTLNRDEAAGLSTAGAITGAAAHFGFYKNLASNVLQFYGRGSATTSGLTTVGTIVPGTYFTAGFVIEKHTTTSYIADLYFNGAFVSTVAAGTSASTAPADATYGPSFSIVNGVGANCSLDVDYYYGINERY